MTIPASLQAGLAALLAFAAWAWWTIRGHRKRAEAAERRAEVAEAERDGAEGRAAVAEAQADVAADHAARTAAGAAAAEEVHRVPSDLDPADRVRAVDDVARRLHAEDGSRPGPGGGDAAAVRDRGAPRR